MDPRSQSLGARPTLWLRAAPHRPILEAHLRHVRGAFRAARWEVVAGPSPPNGELGAVAVLDDPWCEATPELAEILANAGGSAAPRWRLPQTNRGSGRQRWAPGAGPYTLSDYQRSLAAGARRRARCARPGSEPWTGFAVARRQDAPILLPRGWPPPIADTAVVEGASLFCYDDPSGHDRPELERFVPASARTVVDVGCGRGLVAARLRRPGRRVVGIEPDPGLAGEAASRLDLVLAQTAERGLPALRAGIDCILLADVLEHTADPDAVLAAVAERLASDGRLVVSLPNAAWAPVLRSLARGRWDATLAGPQARDHLAVMTPSSFESLASGHGLDLLERWSEPVRLPWGLRLWSWLVVRSAGGDTQERLFPQWVATFQPRR